MTAVAHAVAMIVLSRLRRQESELAAGQIHPAERGEPGRAVDPDGVPHSQRGPTGALMASVPKRRSRSRLR